MTRQRRLILDILLASSEHLSAEEIYRRARERASDIALGTVYRNLGRMVEDGEIRRIELCGAPDRYDRNTIPHDHVICVRCGKVYDAPFQNLQETLQAQFSGKILSYQLNVFSLCGACAQQDPQSC